MTQQPPIFLTIQVVLLLHQRSLAEFGGSNGVREPGLLESALASAVNTFLYGGDLHDVAAAYAFHIAEAQAFLDGNKRTAISSAIAFLHSNGVRDFPPDLALYDAMISIASHTLDKRGLANLFRNAAARRDDSFKDAEASYSAPTPIQNTKLERGSADVDFSEISIEGNTPGVHLVAAMKPGRIGAEVGLVWIFQEPNDPMFVEPATFGLTLHQGLYRSGAGTLGWLVFVLQCSTSQHGQAVEYFLDVTDTRAMEGLRDLDRQSHWHIEARSTAGTHVARFEFENRFSIGQLLRYLLALPTPPASVDFSQLKEEFRSKYSIPQLLSA